MKMMPEITNVPSTLFVKNDSSGEMLELGKVTEITYETEVLNEYDDFFKKFAIQNNNLELTLDFKSKRITRKRFIRLLMSRKIQRNDANELAKLFLKKRGYYDYIDFLLLAVTLGKGSDKL